MPIAGKYNFIIILFLIASGCSRNTPEISVSSSADNSFANEPVVAVNQQHPNEIMIACNLNWAYYSEDSGKSWRSYELRSPAGVWGDFSALCDTAGNFLLYHLSAPKGYKGDDWLDRIVCQRFDKQSKSWKVISYVGDSSNGHWKDKPFAVVNPVNNELALAWTEFDSVPGKANSGKSNLLFSISNDIGKTWTTPVPINKIPGDASLGDSTATAVSLCVNKNGDYFAVWPRLDTLWLNRFDHNTRSWNSMETFVAVQPGGWRFFLPGLKWCNGWPSVCCVQSATGEKFFVCYGVKADDASGASVYYVNSNDEGEHWSAPQQIPGESPANNLFFPVGQNDELTHTYAVLAFETSAEDNKKMHPVMFIYDNNLSAFRRNDCIGDYFKADTATFLGDFISLAAHEGTFYPAWTMINNPLSEIRMARIPVSGYKKK